MEIQNTSENIIIQNHKRYKIAYVNKIDCTSCSNCVSHLPEYFRMDEEDISETHNEGKNINQAWIPEEDWDRVQEEMENCPGECILWKS